MKRIATRTAKKGKKLVKLVVYSCDNILTYEDKNTNYFKLIHIPNYQEATAHFYEWVIQMHNIKIETQLQ